MQTINKEELIELQYQVLGHSLVPGLLTEIRDVKKGVSYYSEDIFDFISNANVLLDRDMYVGINPRAKAEGKGDSVPYVTCVVIDIDPVREKGLASSDQAHAEAINTGQRMASDLKSDIVVSSGSGCHVYFPINPIRVEDKDELTRSLKAFSDEVKKKYESPTLRIDSIFDLPRIIRLWGSHNSKSNRTCAPVLFNPEFKRHAFTFNQSVRRKVEEAVSSDPERRFKALVKSSKRLKEMVDGNIKYESRSESDFEFIAHLYRAHFSEPDIISLMHLNPTGRAGKPIAGKKEFEPRDVRVALDKLSREATGPKSNVVSLAHGSQDYYASLKNRKMGTRTGFKWLDETISGLKPGKVYVIAARPGTGKTSIITQMLTSIAEQGKTCLFFPTECGSEPIFDKIVSRKANVNLKKFQNGSFQGEDEEKIELVKDSISRIPLVIVEDFGLSIGKIEADVEKYAPDVVAIDFFQALTWEDPANVGEKADAFRRIKAIAINRGIPVILASQLNRSEGKDDLRQLNGTGAIEQLGDVICFLSKDDKSFTYPVKMNFNVLKSKYSAIGNIPMDFYSSICEFTEGDGIIEPQNPKAT